MLSPKLLCGGHMEAKYYTNLCDLVFLDAFALISYLN